jgi:dipeptidyl aminopeptidase/acylaminoacyl peptidase
MSKLRVPARILAAAAAVTVALSIAVPAAAEDPWARAAANGELTQKAVRFCRLFARGWLVHADPRSGLLPRNLTGDAFWNAKDSAADNYPFIVLTAHILDDTYLKEAARAILARETKLTARLDSLPDDFLFATQAFRTRQPDLEEIVFGAAEYAKDGLMPITEWLGPSPWLDRMAGLVRDVFKNAEIETPSGPIPSDNVEVAGDLLQVASRLYWLTGDGRYADWAFRLADRFLVGSDLLDRDLLVLRDHGSEIIGGLSEACVLAASEDPRRWASYRPRFRAILDRVLEAGRNPDGLLVNSIDPRTGRAVNDRLADTWGYVFDAYMTMALIDPDGGRYREAAARALAAVAKYRDYDWEGGSADGIADAVEGAINLLARVPDETAARWADDLVGDIYRKQRPDGIVEGWHGDGNSARTALMYALWKTQGAAAAPWRDDLRLGAVRGADGGLFVSLSAEWPWSGTLRFDRPRHKAVMHLPFDYPRINQFPEWFTVDPLAKYEVRVGDGPAQVVDGAALYDYPLSLRPGSPVRLSLVKMKDPAAAGMRTMKYAPSSKAGAGRWQKDVRARLARLVRVDDLKGARIPLSIKVLSSSEKTGHVLEEVEIQSTPGRRIKAMRTVPRGGKPPYPAVVCIHGHGGNRRTTYEDTRIYKAFASALAERGYATAAVDVGQHEIYESGRTLIGERLWDLMRAVDLLAATTEVDRDRIGCAGLSLGGEMAMWLAAMDTRVAACVSSGFLTVMDQMERDHCMCWKIDGLRELVDFADIFALVAPRPLQCQNGLLEPPTQFIVPLARQALKEIRPIYADMGSPGNVSLDVHAGEHEVDLPSLLEFFDKRLSQGRPVR